MPEDALPPSSEATESDRRGFVQKLTLGGAALALAAISEQSAVAQTPAPKPLGTVRISLPASVAFNLGTLQSTIQTVLGKLGCPTCFSGADCQFVQERDFIVDSPAAGGITVSVGETSTAPTQRNTAMIGFGGAASTSITSVMQAIANVSGVLGCAACHSGFDVSFVNEVILLGVTQSLTVQKYGVLG